MIRTPTLLQEPKLIVLVISIANPPTQESGRCITFDYLCLIRLTANTPHPRTDKDFPVIITVGVRLKMALSMCSNEITAAITHFLLYFPLA